MNQNLKKICELKIKADEEGSTSNASQPISRSMVLGGTSLERSTTPLSAHSDGPVSLVSLVSPSTVQTRTNSQGLISPLLVPAVDPIWEDTVAPLTIPSSPSAEMLENLFHPQSPASSNSVDWNDDILMSFFDYSYVNNINDPNHNNNL